MSQFNKEVSGIFSSIADLMEIGGNKDDLYRVRAYRTASLAIASEDRDLKHLNEKELKSVNGIGQALAEKIIEYRTTGKIAFFGELKKTLPKGLPSLLEIPGLGPKHAKLFWKELNITTVPKLKAALQKGVIAELPGFGEKSARKLLDAIENFTTSDRIPREKVMPSVRKLLKTLKSMPQVLNVEPAGSLRRGKATVHDIDILVSSKNPKQFARKLSGASFWKRMIGQGETKVSGIIDGFQCDIRVVAPKSFGAALVYFTGSKGFNIYLRKIAIAKKLKLNEYGLFDNRGKMIAGKTEEEVFKKLGVEYLTPEQRERF